MGIEPQEAYEKYLNEHGDSFSDQYTIYANLVYLAAIKSYNLKMPAWHLCEHIDRLLEQLQVNGAFAVSGKFGDQFYSTESDVNSEKIGLRPLHCYLENNEREELGTGHAILIIGAEKANDNEFIYYLDPNESSESSKVYKLPYDQFLSRIADIYGNMYDKLNMDIDGPFAVCPNIKL